MLKTNCMDQHEHWLYAQLSSSFSPVHNSLAYKFTPIRVIPEMGTFGRRGCCIFGGLFTFVSGFSAFYAHGVTSYPSREEDTLFLSAIVTATIGVAVASHYTGKVLDRQLAIRRIKKRRRQKQGFLDLENGSFLAHPRSRLRFNGLQRPRSGIDVTLSLLAVRF